MQGAKLFRQMFDYLRLLSTSDSIAVGCDVCTRLFLNSDSDSCQHMSRFLQVAPRTILSTSVLYIHTMICKHLQGKFNRSSMGLNLIRSSKFR